MEPQRRQRRLSLPLLVREKNKYYLLIVVYAVSALLYLLAQRFPIFEARQLPLTWLDNVVPFIPTTIWLYTSEYFFFLAVFLSVKGEKALNEYFYALILLQLICVPIFWLWPTIFPRHLFALPDGLDPVSYFVFAKMRTTDLATNCFPSLHVSGVLLSALVLRNHSKKFLLFMIWAIIISISTLTTKQHYFVDVVAGMVLAVTIHAIFRRFVNYKPL